MGPLAESGNECDSLTHCRFDFRRESSEVTDVTVIIPGVFSHR